MTNWVDLESQYYMYCARRQPIVITRGQGTRVWDSEDKEYLDFTAGWAVNSLGHCPEVMVAALQEQAGKLMQTSNQFYTIPQIQLAQILVEHSCLDKVFLCNSGAEANEGAIKLARKYGKLHLNNAFEIIAADNSFHGRTMTTVSATGNPHYQEAFTPLTPGFIHVPFDDISALKSATTDNTCAVILEPVQGEGGVILPSNDYLKKVRQWCNEKGILLILDEVQTGVGRLGYLFGYECYNIEPDVMTLAKGLGGGVPIGAFLCKNSCDVLRPGDHGSTYGGNPLMCAASYAAVKCVIEDDLPSNARKMGERLEIGLEAVKSKHETIVKETRGLGLLVAVELHESISGDLVSNCNEEGLLLNPVRPNTIRFMPPLNVTPSEIDEAISKFEKALITLSNT